MSKIQKCIIFVISQPILPCAEVRNTHSFFILHSEVSYTPRIKMHNAVTLLFRMLSLQVSKAAGVPWQRSEFIIIFNL